MNINYLLSIIIPVYNVQDYLEECLDSVVKQTYTNLEIICVNDGSTDGSLFILERYAQKDSRIKVISKENGGLSSARNAGLDIASGDLISFIDSDDVLALDSFEKNLPYFKQIKDLQILQFPTCFNWTGEKEYLRTPSERLIEGSHSIFQSLWKNDEIIYSAWGKIFWKEAIQSSRFRDGILFEDMHFFADFNADLDSVYISNKGCYFYRWRPGSILVSKSSYRKDKDYINAQWKFFLQSLSNPLISKSESYSYVLRRVFLHSFYSYKNYSESEQNDLQEGMKEKRLKFSATYDLFFSSAFPLKDKIRLFCLSVLGYRLSQSLYNRIESGKSNG